MKSIKSITTIVLIYLVASSSLFGQIKSHINKTIKTVSIDNEYRKQSIEYAKVYVFANLNEDEAYKKTIEINLHYLYFAFKETYPKSIHNEDVSKLLANFSETIIDSSTITFEILKKKYNFDGDDYIYRLNTGLISQAGNFLSLTACDKNSGIIGFNGKAPFGFCFGNLQIMKNNGIKITENKISFLGKTRIIFPTN